MANVAGVKRHPHDRSTKRVTDEATAEIRMRDSADREPYPTRLANRDTVAGAAGVGAEVGGGIGCGGQIIVLSFVSAPWY